MRIFIVISENSMFKPDFLADILAQNKDQVVGVAISSFKPRRANTYQHISRLLILLGFRGVFFIIRHKIRIVFIRFLAMFAKVNINTSCRQVVKKFRVPLYYTKNVNSEEFRALIRDLQVDLIISSGNQIFGKKLLEIPSVGCINRHTSLLPRYQGIYPVFWAMLHGEKEIGVSVHWMEPELDKGDVVSQVPIPVIEGDTFFKLFETAFRESGPLVNLCIRIISEGKRSDKIYPEGDGSYYSYPAVADAKLFKRKGLRIA